MRYLTGKPRDFLLVATPGAGKTTFALKIAGELLADGTVERVTVVVPTEHLKVQWAAAASSFGIARPAVLQLPGPDLRRLPRRRRHLCQVASHPTRHRVRTEGRRTLVIFDGSTTAGT